MLDSLTHLTVESYKAFDEPVELDLAPLTIVLGRNNAGKSALVRAPLLATSGFSIQARSPFDVSLRGQSLGRSLQDCAFDQRLTGLTLGVQVNGIRVRLAAYEQDGVQRIVEASVGDEVFPHQPTWPEVRDAICHHDVLRGLGERIGWLSDERTIRPGPADAVVPERLGPDGSGTLAWLHHARRSNRRAGLDALSTWLRDHMGLALEVRHANGQLECFVRPHNTSAELHPSQVGSGFRQILPVLVALFVYPSEKPAPLLVIEHPELHLHPGLHGDVGELLVERARDADGTRLLVESHSDALLLRVRALIAEARISKDDVAVYFVEQAQRGSWVRRIVLDQTGTPDWWPHGVFAEPTAEFRRIRRALANRGAAE